jgi:hypothetical protein
MKYIVEYIGRDYYEVEVEAEDELEAEKKADVLIEEDTAKFKVADDFEFSDIGEVENEDA